MVEKKVNVNNEELQQDLYELETIKRRIEAIESQLQTLRNLEETTDNLLKMLTKLQEMKNSGEKKSIYVDLGSGIFLKVEPELDKKLLVRIEETVFIEKDLEQVVELVKKNLNTIKQSIDELERAKAQEILKYNQKIAEISKKYQLE